MYFKTSNICFIVNIRNLVLFNYLSLISGNIALHLLTKETRMNFDLETFWSVGEKYDSHMNRPVDSLVSLLNEHSFSLDNLEPVDVENIKTH